MNTLVLDTLKNKDLAIKQAVEILANNGVIAFPTETVYGIGTCIFDAKAIKKVFEIKSRDFSKPMAAHIASIHEVDILAREIPDNFHKLAQAFLPGPLSVVLKKHHRVPDLVTAGLDTIGIRYPSNPVILEIIKQFGYPLAGTSANISGNSSPNNAEEVKNNLNGLIPLIIDDGETEQKQDSTVISLVGKEIKIFREGVISKEAIEDVLNCRIIN